MDTNTETAPNRAPNDARPSSGGPGPDVDVVAPAGQIGRFCVLRLIGSGGMGRVYSAYDPDLDRRVAIKVLHRGAAPRESTEHRLLREAQALARLAHPNVVAVHEVGVFRDRAFVAMEYVEGETLADWAAAKRSRNELTKEACLDVLIQAGQGLWAAHEAGIVHRDFKPSNVLIGHDGRARVADFGLAQGTTAAPDLEAATLWGPRAAEWGKGPLAQRLTVTGTVVGTPRYMAPEQFSGVVVDARADQFAFAVVAWELMYGSLPFDAVEPDERLRQIRTAELRATVDVVGIGPRTARALRQAMRPLPEHRHGSLKDLLGVLQAELEGLRGRQRGTKRVLAGAASTAGLLSIIWAGAATGGDETCASAEQRISPVWNETRSAAMHETIVRSGFPFSSRLSAEVDLRLDEFRERWIQGYWEACRATERGEQSREQAGQRFRCLERAKHEATVVVDLLFEGDRDTLIGALDILPSTALLDRCDRPDWLRTQEPAPGDAHSAEAAVSIRRDVTLVTKMVDLGKHRDARGIAERLVATAEDSSSPSLLLETRLALARTLVAAGELDEAERIARRAYHEALRNQLFWVFPESARTLADVINWRQKGADEGEWLARQAVEIAKGAGDRLWEARARLTLASILIDRGRYADAVVENRIAFDLEIASAASPARILLTRKALAWSLIHAGEVEEARALLDDLEEKIVEVFGANHPRSAELGNTRAFLAYQDGRYGDAAAELRKSAEIRRLVLGGDHPAFWQDRYNYAAMLEAAGKYDESEEVLDEVIAHRVKTLGEQHPNTADARMIKGNIALYRGQFDAAAEEYRLALAAFIAAHGEIHPRVAQTRANLGNCYYEAEDFAEAEAEHRRAVAVAEATYGNNHRVTASLRVNLGNALVGQKQWEEAEAEFSRAIEVHRLATPGGSPDLANALERLGSLLLERSRAGEAEALLREALGIRNDTDAAPGYRGRSAYLLARALSRGAAPRSEVTKLLRDALADLETAGTIFDETRERAAAMLRLVDPES